MPTQIRAIVITVSDACSRGEREDASGIALVQLLRDVGAEIVETKVVSDDLEPLSELLRASAENNNVNLIVTTGGTGFSPRDNTPEATLAVIEREAPGLGRSDAHGDFEANANGHDLARRLRHSRKHFDYQFAGFAKGGSRKLCGDCARSQSRDFSARW